MADLRAIHVDLKIYTGVAIVTIRLEKKVIKAERGICAFEHQTFDFIMFSPNQGLQFISLWSLN